MPYDRSRVAGVVLAAGRSSRFGGEPKALLEVGGETAVVRIGRILRETGVAAIAVVLGAGGTELRRTMPDGAVPLSNPDWPAGRTGSVQVGLEWARDFDRAVLWPVDHPFVRAATVGRLLAAANDPLALWTLPEIGGRGGHPVVVAAPAFPVIAGLGADTPLRSLLPRLGVQVKRVPVDDPAVRWNTDTPESYHATRAVWAAQGGDRWTGG